MGSPVGYFLYWVISSWFLSRWLHAICKQVALEVYLLRAWAHWLSILYSVLSCPIPSFFLRSVSALCCFRVKAAMPLIVDRMLLCLLPIILFLIACCCLLARKSYVLSPVLFGVIGWDGFISLAVRRSAVCWYLSISTWGFDTAVVCGWELPWEHLTLAGCRLANLAIGWSPLAPRVTHLVLWFFLAGGVSCFVWASVLLFLVPVVWNSVVRRYLGWGCCC